MHVKVVYLPLILLMWVTIARGDVFRPTGSASKFQGVPSRQPMEYHSTPNDGSWGRVPSPHSVLLRQTEQAGASVPAYNEIPLAEPTYQNSIPSAPSYTMPTYGEKQVRRPSYDRPMAIAPVITKPTIEQPRYERPGYESKPSYEAPTYGERPSYHEPRTVAPNVHAPTYSRNGIELHGPSYDAPVDLAPKFKTPQDVAPEYPSISR